MGWSSGTSIFDKMVVSLRNDIGLPAETQEEILYTLAEAMENCDWDGLGDIPIGEDPVLDKVMERLHPEWFEEEEEYGE